MQDRDLRPGPRGDMGTFKRNIASAHTDEAGRQGVEIQELLARREMFRPGKSQGSRHGPGCDEYVGACEEGIAYSQRRRPHKARAAMDTLDASLGKVLGKEPPCRID